VFCTEACTEDADCTVGGNDLGAVCTAGRCALATPPAGCVVDGECVAQFSAFTQVDTNGDFLPDANCSATVACSAGQVCVALDLGANGDEGRCATTPTDVGAGPQCFFGALTTVTDLAGASVTVCALAGAADAVCEAGSCKNPCAADGDCAVPGFGICRDDGQCVACLADTDCSGGELTACNETAGTCGCASDAECAGNAAGGNCLESLGVCGCTENANCTGEYGGDLCSDGFCGCAAASDCNADTIFDGTTFVCP
jgi:hypothetical protein